jgi:hypothetical protein
MASNIEITAQLNKMLLEQNQLYLTQAKIQRGQLAIMQQMAEAMGNVDVSKLNENFKQINDQIEAADAALKKMEESGQNAVGNVAGGSKKMKDALNSASDAAGQAAKNIEKMNVAAMAIDGAIAGFQTTFNILGGVKNILKNVISTFGQFALSVIRFPFALWSFLFEKAAGDGGGGSGLREALEAIRKEFGDLSTNGAKAIQDLAKSMSGTLGPTTLSVYKTFGNLAERLKYFTELAKNLGNMFGVIVSGGLIKSAEAVGAFQKGLNISAEGMKAVARQSIISGRTMDEELRETANYAIQMGEAFGINAQVIGHDMAELEADMKHFGGMSKKALSETVVYAHKLGIEVKSLAGIMDTFDNFDTAAEAASKLNQQFGIQIETERIMRAENPAERLDLLRQGLERTGKSFESLSRREQQYLATTVNMSQEEAALAFAQENRGLSLDQIKKKSGEAEKKQLSQAESMQKLAGSIERLIKSGGGLQKGLFAAFFEGFERGIFRSRDFLKVFREIRQVLRTVRRAGIQVGRAFVETFPGVQDIVKGLQGLFNPARWKAMMDRVVGVFKTFFKELQTNPEAGMKNLFDRLKSIFFDHFDASSGAGRKIIEGFKTFFKTILAAGVAGLKIAIPLLFDGLTKIIKGINGFLKGEALPIDVNGFGGQLMEILSGLFKAIKDAAPPLIEALKELFSTAFAKLSEMIEPYKGRIMLLLFGPALFRSALGGLTAGLSNLFIQSMVKAATTASASTAAQGAVGGIARRMPPVPPPGRALSSIPLSPRAAGQIVQTNDALGRFGVADATKLGLKLVAIAAALAVGGYLLSIAVKKMADELKDTPIEGIVKSLAVLGAAAIGMVGLSVAAKALSGADAAKAAAAMPAVVALGALGLIMAVGMGLIIGAFKAVGFTAKDATTATIAMAGAATIFLAAAGLAYAGAGLATIAASGIGGVAIAAGVGLIAVIVVGMIAGTLKIIDAIKNIKIGGDVEGFKVRLDAFTKVFQAIVSFAGVFSAVMAAGAVSSVTSLIQLLNPAGAIAALFGIGPAASAGNPIEMLTELVHSISGGIVDIITELGRISLNPEQLKNLQVIGPIISAIAGLAEAMQPPSGGSQETGLLSSTTEYAINLVDWFAGIEGILIGQNGRGGLIKSASDVIQTLSTIPNVNIEAVKASASILSGIVGLVGSVKIDPEYVKALTEATGRGGIARISAKAEDALRDQVNGVIRIIEAVKDNLPALISGIVEVTKGLSIGQLNRAAKGAEIVGSIIGTVVSLVNSVKETGSVETKSGGTTFSGTTFRNIFQQAKQMVESLFGTGGGGVIKTIVDAISNSGISGLPRGIDTKVKAVSEILNAVINISSLGQEGIGNLSNGITAINSQLNSIAGAGGPFAQMLDSINAVGGILNESNPVNISTSLNRFVNKAGLATGTYTINNRNFTLQVNVEVKLDADRFEQALATRPGESRFVLRAPQGGGAARLP